MPQLRVIPTTAVHLTFLSSQLTLFHSPHKLLLSCFLWTTLLVQHYECKFFKVCLNVHWESFQTWWQILFFRFLQPWQCSWDVYMKQTDMSCFHHVFYVVSDLTAARMEGKTIHCIFFWWFELKVKEKCVPWLAF